MARAAEPQRPDRALPSPADPDLRLLIDAWPALPEYKRAAMLALVASAK